MLKKHLIIVLSFLVVWLSGPHPTCCCLSLSFTNVKGAVAHSCCSNDKVTQKHTCSHVAHATSLSTHKDCCKIKSVIPAVLSHRSPVEYRYHHFFREPIPSGLKLEAISFNVRCLTRNRAPPNLLDMGLPRTYLLKRALLI